MGLREDEHVMTGDLEVMLVNESEDELEDELEG